MRCRKIGVKSWRSNGVQWQSCLLPIGTKRSEMLRFKRIKHAGNSVPGCVGGPVLRVGLQAGGQAEAKSYKYFPQLGSSSRPQGLQSKTLQSALPRGGEKKIKALACHQQRRRHMSNKHLYCSRRSKPQTHTAHHRPSLRDAKTTTPRSPRRRELQIPAIPAATFFFKVGALVCYWLFLRGRGRRRPVAVIGRKFLLLKIPEQPAEPAQFSVQGVVRHRAR